MDSIDKYLSDFLKYTAGVSEDIMVWVYPLTAVFAVALFSYVCTALFRFVVMPAVQRLTEKTKATWDDYLFHPRVMKAFRRIIPPVIWYVTLPYVFVHSPGMLSVLLKVCNIYLVIVSLLFASQFLHSLYDISSEHQRLRNRPLKGIYQMFNLLAFIVGCVLIVSIVIDKSAAAVLAGLGASAAVLMLIFKDTILGLVAGIQLSAHDMLRPGDWIMMDKYGVNGEVEEVTLNTVKVRNWDNTITTVPPYILVSDSFKNWRGMRESAGRRVARAFRIDVNTIRFCTPEELSRFSGMEWASGFGTGEKIVNLHLFRAAAEWYLRSRPDINSDLMLLVRQLEPTSEGLPLQLYFFTYTKVWAEHENIASDVFEHVIAMLPDFGLRIFQRPSGLDLERSDLAGDGRDSLS